MDPADLPEATGTENRALGIQLVRQAIGSISVHPGMSDQEHQAAIKAVVAALKGVAPADGMESMLAVQLVATHNAAMDCLRRAQLDGQSFEGRDLNLKHATKLLAAYARQVEAIDRHRGQGQQKITVEHVTVNAGGQAIVGGVSSNGNVIAHTPAPEMPTVEQLALSDDSPPPMQIIDGGAYLRAKRQAQPIRIPRGR
ncbi:MAG: hypothetical protein WCO67_23580 [Betaproteobacteria bacterium]